MKGELRHLPHWKKDKNNEKRTANKWSLTIANNDSPIALNIGNTKVLIAIVSFSQQGHQKSYPLPERGVISKSVIKDTRVAIKPNIP